MVTLTHLKRPGGATTHNTHDLSTHEMISQHSNICFLYPLWVLTNNFGQILNPLGIKSTLGVKFGS